MASLAPATLFSPLQLTVTYTPQSSYMYETENNKIYGYDFVAAANSTGNYTFTTYLTNIGIQSFQLIISPLLIDSALVKKILFTF